MRPPARNRLASSARTAPLLIACCVASVGCSACSDDRAGAEAQTSTVSSAVKHKKCSEGVVAPDGFAAVTEIPSLAGREIFIQDVNNDGVSVGSSTAADGNRHAIRHTDVGGVQDLGALPGFGTISYASAVASDGAISGNAETVAGSGLLVGY